MGLRKISRLIEKGIIYALIIMMAGILVLATFELGYYLFNTLRSSNFLLTDMEQMMDLFGAFLLVLIGIELLDTIKVYLRENVVHVEVVVLVAIIAIARKVVVLKIEELEGSKVIGIGILILSLSIAYYLIKKSGLLIFDIAAKTGVEKEMIEACQDELDQKPTIKP